MESLHLYTNNYLIVVSFLLIGILLPLVSVSVAARFLRPNKPFEAKLTTYESGIEPFQNATIRFHVSYYIFAILFVIFDVETVFLFAWAVAYEELGIIAFIEMLIFVFFLLIGLVYAWKKKVLKWI